MGEIEIIINPDGSVSVEALGFTGPDCEKATAFIEEALGEVQTRKRKPEYYRRQRDREKLSQG
jgi:hypothetical protein